MLRLISYFTLSVCFLTCFVTSLTFNTLDAQILQRVEVKSTNWADSVLHTLSLEEKIAQLMIIRACSNNNNPTYVTDLLDTIKKYQIGGICFFQGGIARQAIITNQLQKASRIPLLISIDAEWGLAMRLDSVALFPRQMALGATYDTPAIYAMGAEIARQCKRLGIHANYASCIDVNSNANNPVINSRSFGENPQLVADCGIAYMKGLQDNGILPFAKHFPGHGDTESDSHHSLPSIKHDRTRLDTVELLPFKQTIEAGIEGIMIGHLNVPALDSDSNSISSSSKRIVTDLLKNQMQFKGLIITDGLEMKGIADYLAPGDLELHTLLAGNDLLLLPSYPHIVIEKVKEAIGQGILSEKDLDEKCLKVLKMKEKYVLPNSGEIQIENIYEDINSPQAEAIYSHLTQSSITLLKNENNIIPFPIKPSTPLLHFRIDNGNSNTLESFLSDYISIETIRMSDTDFNRNPYINLNLVDSGAYILVSLHHLSQYPSNNYGLTTQNLVFLDSLSKKANVIFVLMGNPYVLNYIPFNDRFSAIMVAYHPVAPAEKAVAQAMCHMIPIQGKLPVSLLDFSYGEGIQTKDAILSLGSLPRIDSIALNGIKEKAYPGCRILVAHKGNIIYNKTFGKHTYEGNINVKEHDLYDLASITKIAATTLAIMKLYDDDEIKLHDKLSKYLPYLKGTNKENITIAEVMTHTSGLKSWIPIYKQTINDRGWDSTIYKNTYSTIYSIKVSDNMYMNSSYIDSIKHYIIHSPMKANKTYEYSDLGFYLLADLIYHISGQGLDEYVKTHFYSPMELTHILFNPLQSFFLHQIPPTENDTFFRKQLIQGYVHDQLAAMSGGVSGHAGLFASAHDLYIILQMLLNDGKYKDKRYLQASTIKYFTSYHYHSCRRGLGFDKPLRGKGGGPCSTYASSLSFGHSGFTGTYCWVDPKYDLVYIFLSNRVYPDTENKRIITFNIRTTIQDEIYKELNKHEN
jgi:beta-glucosidase-like glycosyl hydrolase/CubicO group peptidase (beta-lactamase class C family)